MGKRAPFCTPQGEILGLVGEIGPFCTRIGSTNIRETHRTLVLGRYMVKIREKLGILRYKNGPTDICKADLSGDKEIRTLDPLLAKQVLYQLSYTPELDFIL